MKKILLILLLLLSSCSIGFESNSNSVASKYDSYIISLDSSFSQSGIYYIYFFSPYCKACQSIENDVISKAELLHIYFINPYDDISFNEDPYASISASSWEDLSIAGYPTMMFISMHVVDRIYYGTREILSLIK